MSDQYEWGPWVEHDLGGCPVKDGDFVEIHCRYPDLSEDQGCKTMGFDYKCASWDLSDFAARGHLALTGTRLGILRYRIRRSASFDKLKQLVELRRPVERKVGEPA